jgi:uncharacterized protein with PIN domain/tRNA(Ser,Leu) C12 N-acetylase TAN1
VATYLIRCAETGREQQARLGKLRNDLARVIAERLPGARIETAPGRVVVEAGEAAEDVLAALPGVSSVSPCTRVPFDELERAVVELARNHRAAASTTLAIRIRRGGEKAGASARERRPDLARRLAAAITAATGARIDLTRPDLEIGIELRGDDAFVFDRIVHGIDRIGPTTPPAAGQPRFVADQMLGRLAARLRLLGYDTLTVFDIADSEVTRLAAAEGRILLTRDGPLAQTRAVPVHFVRATEPPEQLTEVLAALQLSPDPAHQFTRCTRCNTLLETVEEAVVRDRLPEGVRDREQVILRCPGCDKLYWRGSHTDRILAELARSQDVEERQ